MTHPQYYMASVYPAGMMSRLKWCRGWNDVPAGVMPGIYMKISGSFLAELSFVNFLPAILYSSPLYLLHF